MFGKTTNKKEPKKKGDYKGVASAPYYVPDSSEAHIFLATSEDKNHRPRNIIAEIRGSTMMVPQNQLKNYLTPEQIEKKDLTSN